MPKRGVIAQAMPQGDIIGLAPPLCGATDAATNAAESVAEVLGRAPWAGVAARSPPVPWDEAA